MKKTSLYIIITLIIATTVAVWYKAEKTVTTEPVMDTIIIGTNSEFPPFSFKKDDQLTGFDIDVITEVFKRLNKKIIFKDIPFDGLILGLQGGIMHVIAAGMTSTKERAEQALFTQPHLTNNPLVIISPKNKPALTNLEDLTEKTVVVNEGYLADSYMSEQPGVTVLRLSSALVSDGMLALESNRADAFVTANHSIKPYFEKYEPNDFYITPIPETDETSSFAVSKYYPELRDDIQAIINQMISDGTLDSLKKKWKLS